ncbi:hypothetical protein [Ferrimicrobium sp.]|uniref:hypothetical protein n=1 Tax=Ferrimicrobium sp. TaxID=2926050 RepID=UPI0026366B6C|nr:hypothetical protein [Ferrimicrobium sp.]
MRATDQRGHKRTPAGTARSLSIRIWLVTIVVLSLILAACDTNSTAQVNSARAKELLTKAYRDTIATGGYAVSATIHETLGRETLKDTRLSGLVTTDPPAAQLELPTSHGRTQEQLTIGDTQYMPDPSTPHSDRVTQWLAFAIPPQASLANPSTMNSTRTLAPLPFLINPAIGQIREVGQAQVNGTPTIEFQTQVQERLEEPPPVPSSGNSIGPPITKALTHVILSIWVTQGAKPLIKQLEIAQQATPYHEKLTTTTITTLSGYGARPSITPPPIASVTTMSQIVGLLTTPGQTPLMLLAGPPLTPNPILTPMKTYTNAVPVEEITTVNNQALVLDERTDQGSELVRFDPVNGAVEAQARLPVIEATTYADGELWVLASPPSQKNASIVEVLNPDTLTMLYRRTLSVTPNLAADAASIAVVDKRVWISTTRGIVGLDADLRHRTSITIARPATLSIEVAGSVNGSALLTSLCGDGGSAVTVQVRNPTTGDLVSSLTTGLGGIGGAAMTPITNRVWLRVATGMGGTLGFVNLTPGNPPTLSPGRPLKNETGIHDPPFPNTLRVSVAGSTVFAYDPDNNVLECRNGETGSLLAVTRSLEGVTTLTSLTHDEIAATLGTGEVIIAKISSVCLG